MACSGPENHRPGESTAARPCGSLGPFFFPDNTNNRFGSCRRCLPPVSFFFTFPSPRRTTHHTLFFCVPHLCAPPHTLTHTHLFFFFLSVWLSSSLGLPVLPALHPLQPALPHREQKAGLQEKEPTSKRGRQENQGSPGPNRRSSRPRPVQPPAHSSVSLLSCITHPCTTSSLGSSFLPTPHHDRPNATYTLARLLSSLGPQVHGINHHNYHRSCNSLFCLSARV